MPTLVEQITYVEQKIKWMKSFNMQQDKLLATKLQWLQSERERLHNQLAQQYMSVHAWGHRQLGYSNILLACVLVVCAVVMCVLFSRACNTPVVFVDRMGVICGCITPANKDMPTRSACTDDVLSGSYERIVVRECE